MKWEFHDIKDQGERWLRKAMHRANYEQGAYVEKLEAEVKRLMKNHKETLSEYPGCVYCMERGTPVRSGEVCSECGDRKPTDQEAQVSDGGHCGNG